MNRPDNGGYRVDCSVVVLDALRKLQRQATRGGRGQAFISAFRRIIQSIRSRPNTVGEPMYRLPSLRLRIRMIVVSPLVIEYGVSETHPFVYIRSGKLLSARNA
jgi:hypothetical protein